MPPRKRYQFTPARNPALRWFLDPGASLPPKLASMLLGESFHSPQILLVGGLNSILLSGLALLLGGSTLFLVFIVIELALSGWRVLLARRALRAAAAGCETPTEATFLAAFVWCSLQGLVIFTAMHGDSQALKLLATGSALGLLGTIGASNFAAPRLAALLVSAVGLPFLAGAVPSGDSWLRLLLLEAPLFHYGMFTVTKRFQKEAIATLLAEHQSLHIGRHDMLTGLLNRAGLMAYLADIAIGGGRRFILFYLDLDGFKGVNDRFGHKAGDCLLAEAGRRLRDSTGPDDIVARVGGDEFVVVAPGLPPASGAGFAERIIGSISSPEYALGPGAAARIGVSVGFACCPEDGTTLDDLQSKADTALYASKRAGTGVQRRAVV